MACRVLGRIQGEASEARVFSSLTEQKQGNLQFEDKWPLMRATVLNLLNQNTVTKPEWHDLFGLVHSVCLWDEKGAAKVHKALQEDILGFIKEAQMRVLSHQEDSALLKAYIAEWCKFFTQCRYLPQPFGQLENTLQGKGSGRPTKTTVDESIVRKLMLDSWNLSIFSNIKFRLQDSAMKLVHSERNGEDFDTQLVIGVRESYVNLSSNNDDKLKIYRENFEKAYIDATENFYKAKASEYKQLHGVQAYMRYADCKLKEEEQRAQRYLESSKDCRSVETLVENCVHVLVYEHKEEIIAQCPCMIQNYDTPNLHLMFSLLDRIPHGIDDMLKYLEKHIKDQGKEDMKAVADIITTDSEQYVEKLLELFSRFSLLVAEAFDDDPRFLTARDKAFEEIVNDTSIFKLELTSKSKSSTMKPMQAESKCPELLANYCDMLLRRTPISKRLTSEEIEAKLKDVLLVLKYVKNKDVFMRYHKVHLTRRLILESSADSEKEENMVDWLREVGVPADFVNKLQRMFQDIKVSEDLNQEFKNAHRLCNESLADSINLKILNAGAWARSSDRVAVTLPMELEDYIPEVEEFYRLKHRGRKLQWHHLMSNGIVSFANKVGRYDLEVTTFQMAVLFSWNERPEETISYESLKLATELPDSELSKTLFSLVQFPKLKRQVLLCLPEAKKLSDITEASVFSINQQFCLVKNNKAQTRGRLSLIGRLQLSTDRGKEEDNESIVQLRILRVQEAIVKILKMRKKISNAALQTELVEILKMMFLPSKKMIKEQIEWLIENKYIRRHDDDINKFIYVA